MVGVRYNFPSPFNYGFHKENLEGGMLPHPIILIAVWTSLFVIFNLADMLPNQAMIP